MSAILYGPCLALNQVTGLNSKKNLFLFDIDYLYFSLVFYNIMRYYLYILYKYRRNESCYLEWCISIIYYGFWCYSFDNHW